MNKQLRQFGLAVVAVVCASSAQAQNDGVIGMLGGARVLVNAPTSVPSPSSVTFPGIGTAPWGGNLSTPITNVQVIRAIGNGSSNTDSLYCTPSANGTGSIPSLTGKIAILYRGICNFSEKAYQAQQAGAIACIIVNNIPGPPVGMAAGTSGPNVTIPVFMVSDVDGASIMNALRNGTTVNMSMSRWSFGSANDIGIMPKSSASFHAGAIPASQLAANNTDPIAYRMYNGSMAVNFGTTTQTNIKNATTVQWTPAGSSTATQVYTDTATFASSLAPSDSLELVYNQNFYNPHAISKGMYTVTSRIIPSGADAIPSDNSQTRTVYVTDSIYCKGTWNNTTMRPAVSLSRPATTASVWSWGPLLYTAVGGAVPKKLQFTLSTSAGGPPTLDQEGATICAFKWVDGSGVGTADGIMEAGELTLVAQGYKGFTTADSSFSDIIVPFDPTLNGVNVVPLTSKSWYYYTVTPTSSSVFIGVDDASNDYMRMFISNKISPASREYTSPQYLAEAISIPNGGSGEFRMIPFFTPVNVSIDSVSIDLRYTVNAAVHTSNGPQAVSTPASYVDQFMVSPNPSTGTVSLNYAFRKDPGTAMVTVMNGLGQAVAIKKVSGATGTVNFDLSNMAAGNYWMVFGSAIGTESRQFQIVK
ncbi:MAG: T9SS type A sorting domain-containing protein [Sphingobacteriales bacterium]|nr:MAG: T9SS type A sorting domain-containing protein [Sphingobacteriales bacterium]